MSDNPHSIPDNGSILSEFRNKDGELEGVQLYSLDERTFGDLLLDWMVASGYDISNTQQFLQHIGLAEYITDKQWHALACGTLAPGRGLAQKLADPISDVLEITKTKVINRANTARQQAMYLDSLEISEKAQLGCVPEAVQRRTKHAISERKAEFGIKLRTFMDRAYLSHSELNDALVAINPEAGGQIFRWMNGERKPTPLNMRLLKTCLKLSHDEHEALIRSCWKEHIELWQGALKDAKKSGKFNELFSAHCRLTICPATCSPYNIPILAESLGVSTSNISRLEAGQILPDAELFGKICNLLNLSDKDTERLAVALSQGQKSKDDVPAKIEALTQAVMTEEGLGQYTDLIKAYRQQTGMSVREVVEAIDVKRDLVAFLEQGKRIVRPETRQQVKDYLGRLGMPTYLQDRMLYAMDYTNLDIAQKKHDLEQATQKVPYDFPAIFRLCRQTLLKADGGIGVVSQREATDAANEQGVVVSEGTIRNWELSIGEGNKDKTVASLIDPNLLKDYMDVIDVPETLQHALLQRLAGHDRQLQHGSQEMQTSKASNEQPNPDAQVTESSEQGRVTPLASKDQAR